MVPPPVPEISGFFWREIFLGFLGNISGGVGPRGMKVGSGGGHSRDLSIEVWIDPGSPTKPEISGKNEKNFDFPRGTPNEKQQQNKGKATTTTSSSGKNNNNKYGRQQQQIVVVVVVILLFL